MTSTVAPDASERTDEPGESWQLTLREYQQCAGIPLEDQIVLIDNRRIFRGTRPATVPIRGASAATRLLCSIARIVWTRLPDRLMLAGAGTRPLFVGFFDASMDKPRDELQRLLASIARFDQKRFRILLGKGDYTLDSDLASDLPDNVDVLMGNNLDIRHDRLKYLPMGRDFRNLGILCRTAPTPPKQHLVYCNFSLDTHPVRRDIYCRLAKKSFVKFEHMGAFLSYPISRSDFLHTLGASKFCIAPRGNALDTFRLWDCLYAGTIPIVVKEAVFHDELEDLPILFLNHIDEFKTLEAVHLEAIYAEYLERKFNYRKLFASHWMQHLTRTPA